MSPYAIKDGQLIKTITLPATATHAEHTALDVKPAGDFLAACELYIEAPALDGTELPAAATVKYDLEDSADNSSFAAVLAAVITQTGAGSVGGDAAATKRLRLPTDIRRYVRVKATGVGNGDCSGQEATVSLLT